MHLLNLRGKVYTNSSYSVGRMFQWLYDGTFGNMIGPKEETLCEKVQVRNSVYFMMCRMLFLLAIFLHLMKQFEMDLTL